MKPQRPATRASARGTPSLSMSDPDVKDSDPLAWAELSSEATSEYAAGIAPPLDAATLTAAEVIKLKSIVSASSATRRTPSPTPLYARLNWTSGRQGDNFVAEPPTLYAQVAQAIEDREETRQRQDGATPLFARLKWSSENRSSSTLKPPKQYSQEAYRLEQKQREARRPSSPPNLSETLIPILRSPSPKLEPPATHEEALEAAYQDRQGDGERASPPRSLVREWQKLVVEPPTSASTPNRWQQDLRKPSAENVVARTLQQSGVQLRHQPQGERRHRKQSAKTALEISTAQPYPLRKTPTSKGKVATKPEENASVSKRLPRRAPPKMHYEPGSWRAWWRLRNAPADDFDAAPPAPPSPPSSESGSAPSLASLDAFDHLPPSLDSLVDKEYEPPAC